ncbi:Asp23/Gls24 family envelope stress response protein [Actinosynnema sp. NPDC050436]|uniref:Asp23/Gls24 family envelope stress response protein n=1 Tax=Actinosynnema sp. NPDC050436 TaxID=3155659 RepID=UPI0033E35B23
MRLRTFVVPLDDYYPSTRDGDEWPGAAAGDRGSLDIHSSVLRKIAGRAVALVSGTQPESSVKVREDSDSVDVDVRLALRYPADVRQAAESVRRSVTDEVERLTGYHVRDVDVTVAALRLPTPSRVG